ncbi:unnamed protein product [Closterium sp. NIES-65]|nr:unnamed protein product [Closterium sp. NIES-65]
MTMAASVTSLLPASVIPARDASSFHGESSKRSLLKPLLGRHADLAALRGNPGIRNRTKLASPYGRDSVQPHDERTFRVRAAATAGSAAADSAEAESTVAEDMKQRRGLRGKTEADVIVIGSGIGGLCCGSLLARYGRDTLVLESHYLPGGAAHGFTRNGFSFDTGPSLFSGLSSRGPQANPLAQVLDALGETVPCAAYDSWMCYLPEGDFLSRIGRLTSLRCMGVRVCRYEGPQRVPVRDWRKLMAVVEPLAGPSMALPPAALRADPAVLLTAGLRYGPSCSARSATLGLQVRQWGNCGVSLSSDGPFSSLANSVGVKHPFVRNWIDLLSFLLSGQKADATIAAEVVYMFAEWYKPGSVMEYPLGGPEAIIEALIRGMEKHGGQLSLNCHVDSIVVEGGRAVGVKLKSGQVVRARTAVVSNASVWDTMRLLPPGSVPAEYRKEREATPECDSFMHLHLGIKKENLPADLEIHHIVVNDWSVGVDAPQNVVLISIPTVLDASLSPPGTVSLHAYTPGTEPASLWQGLDRRSAEYKKLKEERAELDGAADVSAQQAARGRDIQGIPWERLHFTRAKYRAMRLQQYKNYKNLDVPLDAVDKQYKNYKNLDVPLDAVDKEVKQVSTDAEFFSFAYNTRAVKSTIVHFQVRPPRYARPGAPVQIRPPRCARPDTAVQVRPSRYARPGAPVQVRPPKYARPDTPVQLRNLVWATSKHDVYTMHGHTIGHYSALSHRSVDFLDLSGPVVPISHLQRAPWLGDGRSSHWRGGSSRAWERDGGGGAAAGGNGAGMADDGTWEPVGRVQVSTLCVRNGLVAAGGFNGEMVCKRLDSGAEGGVSYAGRITRDESAITNAVEIFESASASVDANNDCLVTGVTRILHFLNPPIPPPSPCAPVLAHPPAEQCEC